MTAGGISVVINTLNEQHNLPFLLRAVTPWADEVVVVDQHSDDRTADVAREHGAKVFLHARTGFVEPARAFAVERASCPWVLILDADEMPHPALSRRLRELATDAAEFDVALIPRANIMLGRWVRHSGWWPARKPRFFRKGSLLISDQIHGGIRPAPDARVIQLPADPRFAIWHFSYHSLEDYVSKVNKYTSIEARQKAARRGADPSLRRLFQPAARDFWRRYVRGGGWRDGRAGLTLSVVRAFYRFLEVAKEWDEPRVPARLRHYDALREELIAGLSENDAPAEPRPLK